MASYLIPPFYAAFIWWFSTGAVLLLVGRPGASEWPRIVSAAGLCAAALFGLALTANDTGVAACYTAFTCTILLWGAQEIAFLAGWLTGPRAQPCPAGARGRKRLGFALQAILYHELMLLACGAAVVALTWNGSNPIGLWTFATLWVLRQSSKINLFLGVPVTNDELMPEAVKFLKTYFVRKSVGSFYPMSVTAATAVLVIMIQRIIEVAVTPFEVVSLTLVSTLFALGVLEHWFMLLPLPAITLWGWGVRSPFPPEEMIMKQGPDAEGPECPDLKPLSAPANVVVLSSARSEAAPLKPKGAGARQRLEDLFRQRFLEQNASKELATALSIAEPAATVNGRGTS